MHGVSRDEFRKSFQYYEDRPDLLRNLLDTLMGLAGLAEDSSRGPEEDPVEEVDDMDLESLVRLSLGSDAAVDASTQTVEDSA